MSYPWNDLRTLSLTARDSVDVIGDLKFNSVSGTPGQYLRKTGISAQSFANIPAADITHGTANQVLVTDVGGSNTTWSSNVAVPGTLSVTSTTNLIGDLQFAGSSGSSGSFLKKTGASTQAFTALAVSDIPGSSTANQLLISSGTNTASWSSNVTVPGTMTVTSTTNLQGNLQLAGASGSSGQFLKKTGAATQAFTSLAASDILGGANNQVLQSNGTNAVWSDNLVLPVAGVLNIAGTSLLQETRIQSTLKLGGNFSGPEGSICTANGSSVPFWDYTNYFCSWYDSNVVDMNNSGGGILTLMQSASANVSPPNSNVTYSGGTFTINQKGNWQICFQTNATPASGTAQSIIYIYVNGSALGSYTTMTGGSVQSVCLLKTYKITSVPATIQIRSNQLAAGVNNTSAGDPSGVATTILTLTRLAYN